MTMILNRRAFTALLGAAAAAGAAVHPGIARAAAGTGTVGGDGPGAALADVERRLDARLGAAILDTQTGRRWSHRADERFPMCSTFKALACAALLVRVDAGREDLGQRVRFTAADLVTWSPVTRERAGGDGMTLDELCVATMTQSDNTAANLILTRLGGPSAVTDFARTLGDGVTRLDRMETDLNSAIPGDPRDTTTPAAMLANLQALVTGDALSGPSRERFTDWLVANRTGEARLRAGLPGGWRTGDRTGAGANGTNNVVAVIWPPGRAPVFATVYITRTKATFETTNAAMADIGRALARAVAG
ncbi:class A beta-lactamase [Azospirillum halopraeferens]|uniref:class A beta-lactamase n=1 Tax=Azospirillum halopraeferens TaxID=34010 RepID=UPI000424AE35|nr:class A beta-lactamase [Azospirillum halopraeferens]